MGQTKLKLSVDFEGQTVLSINLEGRMSYRSLDGCMKGETIGQSWLRTLAIGQSGLKLSPISRVRLKVDQSRGTDELSVVGWMSG